MSSAPPPPPHQSKTSYGHRRGHNGGPKHHQGQQQQQQRYVQKSAAPKPSGSAPPPPLLTAALRSSVASPSASGAGVGRVGGEADGFVAYLPHDEVVAAGLGGPDAQESQAVVDLLNDALAALLRAKPREFWRQVAQNDSLHEFLDSYLQFRHRWYDLPHRAPKGAVAGLVVGELELCRRVFMVLYRISSNKDPGAGRTESLSMKEHAALLQEKRLLDLPKLLDICAIYGHDNGKLTSTLVENAVSVQPNILDGINIALPQFLGIFHTMQQRCMKSLQVLTSAGANDSGYTQLQKDLSEVLDFVNDAIVTLDAFVDSYQPAALLFCTSFEMSYGVEELLNILPRLYDSLLPSLLHGFQAMSSSQSNCQTTSDSILSDMVLGLRMLSRRTVSFGWRLLEYCYLNDQLLEHDVQACAKMFPAKVEDPMIRGDIIIQTLKDINREATYRQDHPGKTFLQALEKEFKLMSRIRDIRKKGWIHMDDEQFQFITRVCGATLTSSNSVPDLLVSSYGGEVQQKDEDTAIGESKLSQIRDLFPDYGKGFLAACLEAYNQNPEEVIQRILDGTLHQDLLALDTTLDEIPQQKPAATVGKDKGKGILVETEPQIMNKPHKVNTEMQRIVEDSSSSVSSASQGSSSASSVPQGRFTRKTDDDVPDSATLDSQKAKDAIRSAVLESQYEYEDEYDDSFDDLGFSVVESSYEETDGANDAETSSQGPRWSSQKKPQYYVKDGKNYSYKVAGSVAVSSAREAQVLRNIQRETIHGLGRGGNVPLGVPNRQHRDMEEEEGNANNFGRGGSNLGKGGSNPRDGHGRRGSRDHGGPTQEGENSNGPPGFGRGGRRGGRNHGNQPEVNENLNGQQRGFGRGAPRGGSRNHDHPAEDSEDPDAAQGFARGGPAPRGGGGGRRGGGRNNHYRRDRAMKKHMQGLTGI
ncbi:activating signal cointegrator 1 complex subunit 2 [Oryza brachyantha]|uniref:CUE domain-containing protein n=1 Tax=Oryza brachyantha TaxID=4533 RepID=J3LL57_ORYBR|nr:activating signal cointegrator 1 complex subunit 2 [Oryza brachyantha]